MLNTPTLYEELKMCGEDLFFNSIDTNAAKYREKKSTGCAGKACECRVRPEPNHATSKMGEFGKHYMGLSSR